jgi:hypothetical protein
MTKTKGNGDSNRRQPQGNSKAPDVLFNPLESSAKGMERMEVKTGEITSSSRDGLSCWVLDEKEWKCLSHYHQKCRKA